MFNTYHATLTDDQLQWRKEKPAHIAQGKAVEVYVTILEENPVSDISQSDTQGQRMADVLEQLARLQSSSLPPDPAVWERETRIDRTLPGREE